MVYLSSSFDEAGAAARAAGNAQCRRIWARNERIGRALASAAKVRRRYIEMTRHIPFVLQQLRHNARAAEINSMIESVRDN